MSVLDLGMANRVVHHLSTWTLDRGHIQRALGVPYVMESCYLLKYETLHFLPPKLCRWNQIRIIIPHVSRWELLLTARMALPSFELPFLLFFFEIGNGRRVVGKLHIIAINNKDYVRPWQRPFHQDMALELQNSYRRTMEPTAITLKATLTTVGCWHWSPPSTNTSIKMISWKHNVSRTCLN